MKFIGEKLFPNNVALCALVNMSLQMLCGAALLVTLALIAIYIPYSSALFAPLVVALIWFIAAGDDDQVKERFKTFDKYAVIVAAGILWSIIMSIITYNSPLFQDDITFSKNLGSAGISAIISVLLTVFTCIVFFPVGNQAHDITRQRLAALLIGIEMVVIMLTYHLTGWMMSGFEIMFAVAAVHTLSYTILKEKFSYKTLFLYLSVVNSAFIINFYQFKVQENIGLSLVLSAVELVVLYFIHQLYQLNVEKCRVKA